MRKIRAAAAVDRAVLRAALPVCRADLRVCKADLPEDGRAGLQVAPAPWAFRPVVPEEGRAVDRIAVRAAPAAAASNLPREWRRA